MSRWNRTIPDAISFFEKHAPPAKKAASLIAEDDVEEEEEDDDDNGPPPLMSGSESEDDDDDDSASSDDDTPVAPKKKSTKAEVSFAQRVQKVAFGDNIWRTGCDFEAVLDSIREMTMLVQTTSQAPLLLTHSLARQIINKCGVGTIAVPV